MKNISSNNYPRKLNKLTTGSLVMQIVKDISIFLPSVFTFARSLFVRHGIEREIQACRDAGRQARRITQIERETAADTKKKQSDTKKRSERLKDIQRKIQEKQMDEDRDMDVGLQHREKERRRHRHTDKDEDAQRQ